jgi:hypothetical protein
MMTSMEQKLGRLHTLLDITRRQRKNVICSERMRTLVAFCPQHHQ